MTWMDTVELKLAAIDSLVTRQYQESLGLGTTKTKTHTVSTKRQMRQLLGMLRKK